MNKTDTKSTVLLKHHLKALKLPDMHAECEKIAQRCAADNADHLAFLLQLSELELIERERKAAERRLKAARFPAHKLLDEFDFSARPSINKPLLLELVKGEYLDKRENILLVGPWAPASRTWPRAWGWRPVPRAARSASSVSPNWSRCSWRRKRSDNSCGCDSTWPSWIS